MVVDDDDDDDECRLFFCFRQSLATAGSNNIPMLEVPRVARHRNNLPERMSLDTTKTATIPTGGLYNARILKCRADSNTLSGTQASILDTKGIALLVTS